MGYSWCLHIILEDTSHIGLGSSLIQYDHILIKIITSAVILFPNAVTVWDAGDEDFNISFGEETIQLKTLI